MPQPSDILFLALPTKETPMTEPRVTVQVFDMPASTACFSGG